MNYSPEFQILAKKVGDASQSLSCCQKEINLQRFIDNVEGLKKPNNVEDFKSNGNHAFVSFDRIAIGCALNYNSPIVIGNTQGGFVVYIRNDLINIHKQFQKFFLKSSDDNYDLLNTLKVVNYDQETQRIKLIRGLEIKRNQDNNLKWGFSVKKQKSDSTRKKKRNEEIISTDADVTYQTKIEDI